MKVRLRKTVDVIQFNSKDNEEFVHFVMSVTGKPVERSILFVDGNFFLRTLDGNLLIINGDFIVYEDGELVIYSPHRFHSKWEEVVEITALLSPQELIK